MVHDVIDVGVSIHFGCACKDSSPLNEILSQGNGLLFNI